MTRGLLPWVATALVAALALGCASAEPPRREPTVLVRVPERVVILPLNVVTAMPAELAPASPAVWSALERYLRAQGSSLKTLSRASARGLWIASIRDARNERETQEAAGFDDAARLFVAKLEEYAEFDAVIMPSLFVQRAVLSGTKASWDGAEATLEIDATQPGTEFPSDIPIEGVAPAASLHAVVLDSDGHKLREARAGLALLVRARISNPGGPLAPPSFSFTPRRDAFEDREALIDGIARALAPIFPPLGPAEIEARERAMKSGSGAAPATRP